MSRFFVENGLGAVSLSKNEMLAFQKNLKALGFDPGALDGVWGPKTKAAMQAWQRARGMLVSAEPDPLLLAAAAAAGKPGSAPSAPAPSQQIETTQTQYGPQLPPGYGEGILDKAKAWWNSQGDTTRYLIMGGGALAAVLAAMSMMPKSTSTPPAQPQLQGIAYIPKAVRRASRRSRRRNRR
jgi:peptidoglycan hydrolase-like protein with peptidoglycan-binding domain